MGRMGLISVRRCFFSKDVASGKRQDRVFEREDNLLTLFKKYEPSQTTNSLSVTGCTIIDQSGLPPSEVSDTSDEYSPLG